MPAKFTVALVLDKETNELWDSLPDGEKSPRIREALRTASIVAEKDCRADAQSRLIASLRSDRKALIMSNHELRYLPCCVCRCDCVRGYIGKDGERVVGEVVE